MGKTTLKKQRQFCHPPLSPQPQGDGICFRNAYDAPMVELVVAFQQLNITKQSPITD